MLRAVSLNGQWRSVWTGHQGNVDEIPQGLRDAAKRVAEVPGDVHLDLMRDGDLPDLFVGTNVESSGWVEDKDFWFFRAFASPQHAAGQRVLLVFHGLDTYATILVNGAVIGRTDNMHRRYTFDVTDRLRESGENELAVILSSPRYAIPFDPTHKPLMWSPERLFCRKAQMSFGWDIAPRLMTRGIWRPVELVIVDGARIVNVFVAAESIESDHVTAQVRVEVERLGSEGELKAQCRIHGTAFELTIAPGQSAVTARIKLANAPLWWPIGYGKPSLVDVGVKLIGAGFELDARQFRTGLRTVELVQDPRPDGGRTFFFRINGRDVFVTGLNWTPADAIFARVTPELITQRLEMVAGIGCNMLRVWGGGIYEPDHFYDECDRLGIMIWQDFMMACGWYPQTDAMAAAFEAEARQIVADLRSHPCIAIWAGDNEIDACYPDLASQNRLTRKVLAGVCHELHPQVPYLPSSPYRPTEKPSWVSSKEGDSHAYDHGTNYRTSWLWNCNPVFMSEFGHLSLPSIELIRRYIPADSQWPLENTMWSFHGSNTIRDGGFRVADRISKALSACGKPTPKNVEECVVASQELQAEAVIAWIERYNENAYFGGFMLWNVHDCWPESSDALIDYTGRPKVIMQRLGKVYEKVREGRK